MFHRQCAVILWIFAAFMGGCEKKAGPAPDPLPVLAWQNEQIPPFLTSAQWKTSNRDWQMVSDVLRSSMDLPEALETRLLKEDREIWKNVLTDMERYQFERKNAQILSNIQLSDPVECQPPVSAFNLLQRSQIQMTLQQHRNVLWHMGRLEMATNGVSKNIQVLLSQFKNGHIRDAETAVLTPIANMVAQIKDLRANHPSPRGDWAPGKLQFRMARTAHAAPVFLQAKYNLADWQMRMKSSDRWQYLANSAAGTIDALNEWIAEFEDLMGAYQYLASSSQTLERVFAPPHAFVAYPCIGQNLRRMRVLSDLYSHVLPMQWALVQAYEDARRIRTRLASEDYAGAQQQYLTSEIDRFMTQVGALHVRLSRVEDLLLILWDETNDAVWDSMHVFVDPLHKHSLPAIENAQTWNSSFREIKNELAELERQIGPEPVQPLNKRGKPMPSYIAEIVETLHAPARIDDVERSLLAISELEAHMVSIRDELMRLCKQGACRSFPEAEIANSPKTSAWVVSWRQSPSNERTLGQSLIVIKLCALHLSRLVQRLAEIHAWFAETSNADLTWKKLKSWQRIWTLYAEPNGTYAAFLKSIATLDESIANMAQPQKNRMVSPQLQRLLILQDQFFDLTIDYARFIDAKMPPPTSFDDLLTTWESLDNALVQIDEATRKRDETEHPEWQDANRKRNVVDIPR